MALPLTGDCIRLIAAFVDPERMKGWVVLMFLSRHGDGDIKFAVCLCFCLFETHLLRNCWRDLAEISYRDTGLSGHYNSHSVGNRARIPPGQLKMWFSYAENASLWQPLFQKRFFGELFRDGRPQVSFEWPFWNGMLTGSALGCPTRVDENVSIFLRSSVLLFFNHY